MNLRSELEEGDAIATPNGTEILKTEQKELPKYESTLHA